MAQIDETNIDPMISLLPTLTWYKAHFHDAEYKLAIITKAYPARRYWFANDTIHCHAGNFVRPCVTYDPRAAIRCMSLADGRVTVALLDQVLYVPDAGPQGQRAYRWLTVNDLINAYQDYTQFLALKETV